MRHQVVSSLLVGALALAAVALVVGRSSPLAGMATGLAGGLALGVLGWWSLRAGRHTAWAEAERAIAPGHAVVLWKPGCPYCERLLRALGADERVTWVNVWQDPAAQARVCELNGGDEYTPTVLVGTRVLRNPTAAEVRAALA